MPYVAPKIRQAYLIRAVPAFALERLLTTMQENTIWVIEWEGKTLDGKQVVTAMMEGRKVYSVPK